MRDRVLAVWRAGVFLLAGALTGLVSLIALSLLLVLSLVARPAAQHLLGVAVGYERRRVAAYTGRPIPEAADPDTRRRAAWFVTHALAAPIVGLVGVSLPAAAINAA